MSDPLACRIQVMERQEYFSGDMGEMWREDSGDGSPLASIAVYEASRNGYRAAPEKYSCRSVTVPLLLASHLTRFGMNYCCKYDIIAAKEKEEWLW